MAYVACKKDSKGKYKQVSPEYTAPEFCRAYIDLAIKNGGGKGLKVMFKNGRKLMTVQEAEANIYAENLF